MRRIVLVAFTLMFPAVAAAQPVSLLGRIEKLPAPAPCAPQATHRVQHTNVHLFSTTLNLDAQPGIPRRIIGNDVSTLCPLLDVTAVENSPFQLNVCNTPALGCAVTVDMCPHASTGAYVIFVGAAFGYSPVSLATGTFLIDPALFFPLASGTNNAVCQSVPLTIAGPPVLVGLDIYFQAAQQAAGPPLLSNLTKITVQAPSVPCTAFECF